VLEAEENSPEAIQFRVVDEREIKKEVPNPDIYRRPHAYIGVGPPIYRLG
jgi:hypothetical protein